MWTRRQFLRLGALGGAAAASACGGSQGGADGPDAAPGDPSCQPTRGDAQGPFFEPGAPMRVRIADDAEPGERLDVDGRVLASDCATPVAGAVIDVWQADRTGAYHDAGTGYRLRGVVVTDADGRFRVETIRPGNYQQPDGSWRPAHLHLTVTARGFRAVTTQIYFQGDRYLAPNDGCTGCGSDDPDRILALAGSAAAGWTGQLRMVLRA